MQTSIENNSPDYSKYLGGTYFQNDELSDDLKIVDYMKETKNGESVITLYSQQLFSNKIKVNIRSERIILVISEVVDTRRNNGKAGNTWEVLNKHTYTRIQTIRIMLPGDNFYMLRNYELKGDLFLKIVLGQLSDN
ncbi:hypothetical protein [uncultured Draconibacterium sp.]|uniref:hypothetical protein n=1 Tax=uncultured Draconibacterium sp. TaxID=1573823 RepID=UPI003216DEA8